jgi:tetratricopeptide (TPR) repeat protein
MAMNHKEKILLNRGIDKVKRKKYEEALDIFERVLAMNQEVPEAWNNKAVALYGLGRLEEALESYDQCLALDPENLDALRNKGFLLRNLRRLDEALEVYDCVLQKGGDAYDMESTATVLTALGRLEEALNCLYLAREEMSLPRLEDEIAMVKGLIEKRGSLVLQEKESRDVSPPEKDPQERGLQGKE